MEPLIAVAELAQTLNDPDLVVVDCRHQLSDPAWGRASYQAAHLPGALFLHLDEDLSGPATGRNGRHPLPDPHMLAHRLGSLGIHKASRVVAYDDPAGVPAAARLWWLLGWLGFSRVQVLDGGFSAWCAGGLAVTADTPARAAANFEIDLQPGQVVCVDEMLANLDHRQWLVIDARSPERYRGLGETIDPVGGHIPHAANRFFQLNLEQGLFKPPQILRAEWSGFLGGWAVDRVVHQCGSGVTACHNLLALARAGLPGGRLYAGSWSEWCADPARPVSCD